MEQNVFNATYLNIGIMIWNNVFIVKETSISTQFQELVNHAQLINLCSETMLVKLAHQVPLMILYQTLVKKTHSIQPQLLKFQFIQPQLLQQVTEKIKKIDLSIKFIERN